MTDELRDGRGLVIGVAVWVAVAASLAVVSGVLVPEQRMAMEWVAVLAIPAFWALVEYVNTRQRGRRGAAETIRFHRWIVVGMATLAILEMAPELLSVGWSASPEWSNVLKRTAGISLGAGFVLAGNRIPKLLPPWGPGEERYAYHAVTRFSGWAGVLSGLLIAIVWVALPVGPAGRVTGAVSVACAALLMAAPIWSCARQSSRGEAS